MYTRRTSLALATRGPVGVIRTPGPVNRHRPMPTRLRMWSRAASKSSALRVSGQRSHSPPSAFVRMQFKPSSKRAQSGRDPASNLTTRPVNILRPIHLSSVGRMSVLPAAAAAADTRSAADAHNRLYGHCVFNLLNAQNASVRSFVRSVGRSVLLWIEVRLHPPYARIRTLQLASGSYSCSVVPSVVSCGRCGPGSMDRGGGEQKNNRLKNGMQAAWDDDEEETQLEWRDYTDLV